MPNNFTRTINNPREARRAVEMFKDEYLLDFINVEEIGEREKIDVDERVVEQSIVQNIKNFIMTFGRDFAFIGNQYHLEIYGVEQFPDLLFFNRELNAMVCIELKLGEFKTSYLGQLFAISKFSTTRCVSHTRIRLLESFFANQQTTLMQNMLFETTASRWELLPTRRWMTCLKGYARLCLI